MSIPINNNNNENNNGMGQQTSSPSSASSSLSPYALIGIIAGGVLLGLLISVTVYKYRMMKVSADNLKSRLASPQSDGGDIQYQL